LINRANPGRFEPKGDNVQKEYSFSTISQTPIFIFLLILHLVCLCWSPSATAEWTSIGPK
jgi:hypothetical protein